MRNMLLKATFQHSFWGWFGTTSAVTKNFLSSRSAYYNFVSVENTSLSQECMIYSPPFEWTAPPIVSEKRCDSTSQNQTDAAQCWGNPNFRRFHDNCTRPNSRAAPLFLNLNYNLCPTLTAHSELTPFSELAKTRVQASNPYLMG